MQENQKQRFNSMAKEYDTYANVIVPKYDEIQSVVSRIIKTTNEKTNKKTIRVMDLGAGSGILLKKLCDEFNASCVWQDFSEDFMEVAKDKLKNYDVGFIFSDLNNKDWNKDIDGKFDVIVSSNAIHHLKDSRKRELYSEIFNMLDTGGLFLNADEVKGESDLTYLMFLKYWDEHVKGMSEKGLLSLKMIDVWDQYVERNIVNFNVVQENPKDIHCSMNTQLLWLKDMGYKDVECFWKNFLWAVFGGFKS
jgi:tRNA (cmo5U34)-methyltransferase